MKKINLSMAILLLLFFMANNVFAQKAKPWIAPESSNSTENPLKGDVKAAIAGQKIFNQMCYICHGLKGIGDGAGGMSLNPKPANFLLPGIKAETDGNLFWKLTVGRGPMLSYEQTYSEKQRWQLVNYIRQLQKNNN